MDPLKKNLSFSSSTNIQRNFSIWLILKGMIFAFLFSLICFLILSLILTFTNISESIIKPASYIIMIISIVVGSGVAQSRQGDGCMVHYRITLYYYTFHYRHPYRWWYGTRTTIFSRIIIGIVAGGIGGILGINLNSKHFIVYYMSLTFTYYDL